MNRVEFYETRRDVSQVYRADRWALTPHGRLAPLLRKVFAWLAKHGHMGNVYDEKVEYTRHRVDTDSLLEALFRQQSEAMRVLSRDVTRVLMGPEDYAKLTSAPEILQHMTFNAMARDRHGVFGMTIEIIPWMRGVLVVP